LVTVVSGVFAAWGVVRVVAWARDLPNRVVIDGDAMADFFSVAVVQAYHDALAQGDSTTQRAVISEFAKLVADDPAGRTWVQSEYLDDLQGLTTSSDPQLAAEATELLAKLSPMPDDPGE
ncbi:MAG: hypothetical protein HKN47_26495, partial [Pirellulaceae bacterium]|nr:hypothetical protein [Pirellulaceae bacterium]